MNDKKNKKVEPVVEPIDIGRDDKPLTKKQLKAFLESVRDKAIDGSSAPIYSLASMNYILNMPNIYELLDEENKEIARDIWFRIKAHGVTVQLPPLLFDGTAGDGR